MRIGKLALWLGLALPLIAADYPVVTVCDVLKDLASYNGKMIVVVGKRTQTGDGAWLAAACPAKLIVNGLVWANQVWLSSTSIENDAPRPSMPHDFKWDDESVIRKLHEVRRATRLRAVDRENEWTAVFGRLETTLPLQPPSFGRVGAFPAQIVRPDDGIHEWSAANSLWASIKASLTAVDGAEYFETNMKGALIPGGAGGVSRFRGTVVSSTPAEWPKTIVLALSGDGKPDVHLKLNEPWNVDVQPGTTVEFEGVAVEFTRMPFTVTFEVTASQVAVLR